MKKLLILFILILANTPIAYCQQHVIRFIHFGDEDKPVGTLLISVEKYIEPNDRPTDKIFGKGLKIDLATFLAVRNYIDTSRDVLSKPLNPDHDTEGFKIVDLGKSTHYTYGRHSGALFKRLRQVLIEKRLNPTLIEILDYY